MTELWDRLSADTQEADGVRRTEGTCESDGQRKRPGPGLGIALLVLQRVTDAGEPALDHALMATIKEPSSLARGSNSLSQKVIRGPE